MLIYVHLPFCKAKCRYCDFNSYADCSAATVFSYLSALKTEIRYAGAQYKEADVDTVYIGGGTPSMLDQKHVESVVKALKESFDLSHVKEFTIEANPESVSEEKLAAYRALGINRISVGVQSLSDLNLRSIGRLHDSSTAIEKLKLAGRYFDNVSCDLIIGLPFDDQKLVEEEIMTLAPLVTHMSVYQLTLEDGTPLKKRVDEGKTLLPSDDEVADMMDVAIDALASCGIYRYEVSNFAREGRASMHNVGYWKREEYLGFGAGAHSYLKTSNGKAPLASKIRFASPKDLNAYIAGINCVGKFDDIPRVEMNVLTKFDILNEQIMLGLRLVEGVDESLLKDRLPHELDGFFRREGGKIALNRRGMEVMNGILVRVLSL